MSVSRSLRVVRCVCVVVVVVVDFSSSSSSGDAGTGWACRTRSHHKQPPPPPPPPLPPPPPKKANCKKSNNRRQHQKLKHLGISVLTRIREVHVRGKLCRVHHLSWRAQRSCRREHMRFLGEEETVCSSKQASRIQLFPRESLGAPVQCVNVNVRGRVWIDETMGVGSRGLYVRWEKAAQDWLAGRAMHQYATSRPAEAWRVVVDRALPLLGPVGGHWASQFSAFHDSMLHVRASVIGRRVISRPRRTAGHARV